MTTEAGYDGLPALRGTRPARSVVVAENISKAFPGGDGVAGIDLDIDGGTIFGLIGPSGSGKTTTVRMFTGALEPTSGEVRVMGVDPGRFTSVQKAKLGYMPQLSVLYPELSVEENLNFFASIYGMSWRRSRVIDRALEFVELADHRTKRVRDISGGMQRRLSLATTLIHRPQVLFLDEPTAGIDPVLRRKFWDRFTELAGEGRTIIVTTQYLNEAAYCDQVALLSEGELLLVDTPDGLRRAAFGGDVVDLDLGTPVDDRTAQRLAASVGAEDFTRRGPASLRVVVEEAGTAMPRLMRWCDEEGLDATSADEYLPPFDDVFVTIVERHRAEMAPSGDATDVGPRPDA